MGLRFIIFAVLISASQSSLTDQTRSRIEAENELSDAAARQGITSLFDVLKQEFAKIANGSQDNNEPILPTAAQRAAFELFKAEFDAFFNATILADPSTSATVKRVRPLEYAAIQQLVGNISAGVELIRTENCAEVQSQVQVFEDRAIISAAQMLRIVYIPMMEGRDLSGPVGAAILSARRRSISQSDQIMTGIFNGIKLVLTEVCPELRFPGLANSTLQSLEDVTLATIHKGVDGVFRVILVIYEDRLKE